MVYFYSLICRVAAEEAPLAVAGPRIALGAVEVRREDKGAIQHDLV